MVLLTRWKAALTSEQMTMNVALQESRRKSSQVTTGPINTVIGFERAFIALSPLVL